MARRFAIFVLFAAVGCTSARYVQRGEAEGVVAVPDRSNTWPSFNHDKAVELIVRHVGPDYEILRAEEVNAEPPTKEKPAKPGEGTNVVLVEAKEVDGSAKEYRIWYRKRSGASSPPPADGSAPLPSVLP